MPRCPLCHRRVAQAQACPVDGGRARAKSELGAAEPPQLEGYRVLTRLGAGGAGTVWAAQAPSGSPVAVKVGHSSEPSTRMRFRREARALESVPGLFAPTLHDAGELDDGRPFMVMELMTCPTLAQHLEGLDGPPQLSWTESVARAVFQAVAAVHDSGRIHRDLKPENIFLRSTTQASLVDFGLAIPNTAADDDRVTTSGAMVGSVEYASPEQISGVACDERSDIYALGIILYELLTLRTPFVGSRAEILRGHQALRPPRPCEFRPIAPPIDDIIMRCLEKEPGRRPQTVAELERAFSQALKAATARPRSRPSTKTRMLTDSRRSVVLLAVDSGAATTEFAEIVRRYGAFVVRRHSGVCVVGFSGVEVANPVQSALALAARLALQSVRCVLHIELLRVRRSDSGPPKVYGEAVELPDTWMPSTGFAGVLLTSSFAEALPIMPSASDAYPGFFVTPVHDVSRARPRALVGRAGALAALRASFARSVAGRRPGLFTLLGAAGIGKTRLLNEIVAQLSADTPGVRVLRDIGEINRLDATAPTIVAIDNAELLDDAELDSLEALTLSAGHAVWVVVTATSKLEERRPEWGGRADSPDRLLLEPLSEAESMEIASALIQPVEFAPVDFLRRLARWSGGNPAYLEYTVRMLKRQNMIRRRDHDKSWFVATAELDRLREIPMGQWLALRQLEALPPEIAACARICAVFGATFSRKELAVVLAGLERQGKAGSRADAGVALVELTEAGVIRQVTESSYRFATEALQRAIHETLSATDAMAIHTVARDYWQPLAAGSPEATERFARHASASGARRSGAEAYIELGTRAASSHEHVNADYYFSRAVACCPDDADHEPRSRALEGRGRVRYRIGRIRDALEDLRTARRLIAPEDVERTVNLMLEEATALDHSNAFFESARLVDEALSQIGSDSKLVAKAQVAKGRTLWRQGKVAAATDELTRAVAKARELGDVEAETIGLLLLAPGLVVVGKLEDAHRCFDEVLELCAAGGDLLHLAAAYTNRTMLWGAARDPERAIHDLRAAVRIARDIAHPHLECGASYNLAELLYWKGDVADATALARRAQVLRDRFFLRGSAVHVPLLYGRLLVDSGDEARARQLVARIKAEAGELEMSSGNAVAYSLLHKMLVPDGGSSSWSTLADEAEKAKSAGQLQAGDFLEVLFWWARSAKSTAEFEQAMQRARPALAQASLWRNRFARLHRARRRRRGTVDR